MSALGLPLPICAHGPEEAVTCPTTTILGGVTAMEDWGRGRSGMVRRAGLGEEALRGLNFAIRQ